MTYFLLTREFGMYIYWSLITVYSVGFGRPQLWYRICVATSAYTMFTVGEGVYCTTPFYHINGFVVSGFIEKSSYFNDLLESNVVYSTLSSLDSIILMAGSL